jgi:hypothetical protein
MSMEKKLDTESSGEYRSNLRNANHKRKEVNSKA